MAAARRDDLGLVPAAAHHLGGGEGHSDRVPAGRPAGLPHQVELCSGVPHRAEGQVEFRGEGGRQTRRPPRTAPTHDDRRAGPLHRLGQRRAVGDPVVASVEGELLTVRCPPQPRDDTQLLLQPLEPLPQRRERDAVGGVFGVVPASTEAELHPAAAHGVDLGHRDGQRARVPEGGGGHQRTQPDPAGLPGDAGQGDPGVGRSREAVTVAHGEVVVAAEEGVEAEGVGRPGPPPGGRRTLAPCWGSVKMRRSMASF
jgi:hypothetical protein